MGHSTVIMQKHIRFTPQSHLHFRNTFYCNRSVGGLVSDHGEMGSCGKLNQLACVHEILELSPRQMPRLVTKL